MLKFKPRTVEKNSLPTDCKSSDRNRKLRLSMSVQCSDHWATEVADNSKRVIYVCVRYAPMISTRMDDSPFGQTFELGVFIGTAEKSVPNLVNCEVCLQNIVKYGKYCPVKFCILL